MKKSFLVFAAILLASFPAMADTWNADAHAVSDVRIYNPNGDLVFQFSPALPAGCPYNNHAVVSPSTPGFNEIFKLVTLAFLMQKKIQIIYSGCNGNVAVTGVILLPE